MAARLPLLKAVGDAQSPDGPLDQPRGYGRIQQPPLSTWLGLLLAVSRVRPGPNVVQAKCDTPPQPRQRFGEDWAPLARAM